MLTHRAFSACIVCAAVLALHPTTSRAGFWVPAQGPPGGHVQCMLVLSTDTLVAGTYFGGIYRSTDGGATWQSASSGLTDMHIFTLVAAPGGALYAGTYGGGVCVSSDRGIHWASSSSGLYNLNVWSLAAKTADTLFAGTFGAGVFRSTDKGATWTNTTNGFLTTNAYTVQSLAIHPDGRIFAGTYDYVYRSTDNGNSWTRVNTGLGNQYCWAMKIRPDGFIAVGTPNGCYLSSNGGDNWSMSGININTSILSLDSRASGELIGAGGSGVFHSTDNGVSWTPEDVGLYSTDISCVRTGPGSLLFAGGGGAGVFKSLDDGVSWSPSSTGLVQTQIESVAAKGSANLFAGATRTGVLRSPDHGATWTLTTLTNKDIIALAVSPAGDVLAGTVYGAWRTTDDGVSWNPAGTGLGDPNVWALLARANGYTFAGTSTTLYRLQTFGGSWQLLSTYPANASVVSLAESPSGSIFAGSGNSGVWKSTDNGDTWNAANNGISPTQRISALAVDASGRIFAGTLNYGVNMSTNDGASWTQVAAPGAYVRALTVNQAGHIYASVYAPGIGPQVWRSIDHGASWDTLNSDLAGAQVISLASDSSGFVYAGTDHNGVFRSFHTSVGVEAARAPAAAGLRLESLRPNPAFGPVRIQYALGAPGTVTLRIFDALGRQIENQALGRQGEGDHEALWSPHGAGAGAGVYWVRLESADGAAARKVVVMK